MATSVERSQLPVLNRPIDNTALSSYLTCPREYFFGMILHRRAPRASAALNYGTAWHKALEIHYKTNGNRDAVLIGLETFWNKLGLTVEGDYRTLARCQLDYDRYFREFGKPSTEPRQTVGWPDHPLVEIATDVKTDELLVPWAGKLDRIIRTGGLYYVEDHKTTSRFDKNYFKQFPVSYQMMGYTYLAKHLFPQINVVGVRINLAHILTNKTEFLSEVFPFSRQKLDEWVKTTNSWTRRLLRDTDAYNTMRAAGSSDWDAMMETFPAHWGLNGCDRKFGMCAYHSVCENSPDLQQRILERDYTIRVWDPHDVADEI